MMNFIEQLIEAIIFRSRWVLAPMYLGLVGGLVILMVKFAQEFMHIVVHIFSSSEQEVVLSLLALVDMTLVANLLIMVIFSGYENFVSKINGAGSEDRPDWMGKVDFSGLKLKLIGSIVAISAIDLLKAFVNQSNLNSEHIANEQMGWMLATHMAFIVSGVLFAVMDYVASKSKAH